MKTWGEEREEIGALRQAQEDMLHLSEIRFGPVPPGVVERVRQIDDKAALAALLVHAATAASLAETGLV